MRRSTSGVVARFGACLLASAGALFAHGYGTRPPWVSAGVVRVLAPDDDAYLEVRLQHSGHLGARGALSAPDMFRIVRPREPATAAASPRWSRALDRRPLAPGDAVLGAGALARAPLALALFPEGVALAVADRDGLTVQERDGRARFSVHFDALFDAEARARCTEEHGPNAIWPFGWLEAPPRAVELWTDGVHVAVALRAADGAWLSRALDAATGAEVDAGVAAALSAASVTAPAAPGASVGLELEALALLDRRSAGEPPGSESQRALSARAASLLANPRATVEARLVAARVLGLDAPTAAGAGFARGVLERGDGHPSMDDLLACAVLAGLAPPEWAPALADLALARGVPELAPALTALGADGVTALCDVWEGARNGRLSPYADPRVTVAALEDRLARVLADASPTDPSDAVDPRVAALCAWLGVATVAGERSATSDDEARARAPLLHALLRATPREPRAGEGAWRDARATLLHAVAAPEACVHLLEAPATRPLLGALVAALDGSARRRGEGAVAALSAALARLADLPPEPAPAASLDAVAGWRAWWAAARERPQVAELSARLAGPPSAAFGVPDPALQEALDALFAAPGALRWQVLARALSEAEDRVDELGLRRWLRARLAEARPGEFGAGAEAAARATVAALLAGA